MAHVTERENYNILVLSNALSKYNMCKLCIQQNQRICKQNSDEVKILC